jgi:plastocyanin
MYRRVFGLTGLVLVAAALPFVPGNVIAGPDKVNFPAEYSKGVLYGTVDRYDNKQVRELYANSREAAQAAKEGKPVPHGSVLTMVIYKAQLDPEGNPMKDAKGRFIKGELANVAVMEKRPGWGSEYPDDLRNGEWEYSMFNADGKFNDKANIKSCFECHKPHAKQDFVMSHAMLAGTFPAAAVAPKSGPNDVNIAGFAFGPAKLTVPAGKAVNWTNTDDSPHQIVVKGKPLKTAVLLKGQSEALSFDEAGTYEYICGLHPTMKGTIEVTK